MKFCRFIFAALSLVLLLAGAADAQTWVQGPVGSSGNTAALAITFGANVAANNLIAVVQSWNSSTIANSAPTDTLNLTWVAGTSVCTDLSSPGRQQLWFAVIGATGGAETVTLHVASAVFQHGEIDEYSGMATSAVLDQGTCQSSGGTASTTCNSGTMATTTNAADLLFGGCYTAGNNETFTAGACPAGGNYTIRNSTSRSAQEDCNVTTTGAYSATITFGTSTNWVASVMALKASGGGGPAPINRRLTILGVGD